MAVTRTKGLADTSPGREFNGGTHKSVTDSNFARVVGLLVPPWLELSVKSHDRRPPLNAAMAWWLAAHGACEACTKRRTLLYAASRREAIPSPSKRCNHKSNIAQSTLGTFSYFACMALSSVWSFMFCRFQGNQAATLATSFIAC